MIIYFCTCTKGVITYESCSKYFILKLESFYMIVLKKLSMLEVLLFLGAGGAAYGAVRGVTSDNTTVMGGSVGGGTFGAALGVGAAYALHKNAGARSFLKDIHASALVSMREPKNLAERMETLVFLLVVLVLTIDIIMLKHI